MNWEPLRAYLCTQGIYALRIVLAGVCGGLIGYERNSRSKAAGIRTHVIVCLAAALMMLVSKYGFADVLSDYVRLDPSRVAAGVVTAIGFLGAGMIFMDRHSRSLQGITTSAGVWATLGIGVAIGAGMYAVGVFGTLIVLLVQIVLHKNLKHLPYSATLTVTVSIRDGSDGYDFLRRTLEARRVKIVSLRFERDVSGYTEYEAEISVPNGFSELGLAEELQNNPDVKRVEL